jgi:hypothetical protein
VTQPTAKEHYYRTLLDAMPLMVFVVDNDIRILDLNRTAEETLGKNGSRLTNLRSGEVLQCVHSKDVADGCGKGPHCNTCAIRNSVRSSCQGKEIRRRRSKFRITQGTEEKEVEFLITATPFYFRGTSNILLILEDISEITMLRALIPICARCKKIRGDDEYWKNVETYFNDFLGIDFTHGFCPDCARAFSSDWSDRASSSGMAESDARNEPPLPVRP